MDRVDFLRRLLTGASGFLLGAVTRSTEVAENTRPVGDPPFLVDEQVGKTIAAGSRGAGGAACPDNGCAVFDPRAFKEGMGAGNASVDSEGFRLAVAAAQANGMGAVWFKGFYHLGETLVIPRGVSLEGAGMAASVLSWDGASAAPLVQVGVDTSAFNSNTHVRNLSLRNADGTATWALKLVKSSFGNVFSNLSIAVTQFAEGGIDVADASIVNYLEHNRIERQPIAIRVGPGCNGLWMRGGQLYGNDIGIYLPSELSECGISEMNLEGHTRWAVYAKDIRGLNVSKLRLEKNYFGANDPASAQVYLERCSGMWDGGYITGGMSHPESRPSYALRFVDSRTFWISGLTERFHAIASVTADAASARRVHVGPCELGTPLDDAHLTQLRSTMDG